MIKERNCQDLAETEEIKKRWQEYTEELNKIGLNDLDNRDGVVTNQELDIVEYGVKWALRNITVDKRSQDGRGIGWEGHFLPHRYIKKSSACGATFTKQLLIAGGGPQIPRKVTNLFEMRYDKG